MITPPRYTYSPRVVLDLDVSVAGLPRAHAEAEVVTAEVPTFPSLVTEHTPFVWRVLRHLGVDEADLADACQEVFLAVHRKLGAFEGRSSVRTWLYGISVRVASHVRERAHRRHEKLTARPPEAGRPADQDEEMERRRLRAILRAAIAELEEPRRTVFVLHDVEELPMAEIAQAVGCPIQTAYSRLHAARKQVAGAILRLETRTTKGSGS